MNKEINFMEVVEILKDFSSKIDQRLNDFDQKLDNFNQRLSDLNQKIDDLRVEMNQRFDYHETWLNRIEARCNKIENNMVTKNEFNGLVNLLKNKELISAHESAQFVYSNS